MAKNVMYELDFVVVDESINRYGYRILVDGISTDGFLKNPVCCLQHDTYGVSIGRWKNLRTGDGKLTGTLEFDPDDEMAMRLYAKYTKGYMSAVSLSIIPVEESESPGVLLPGQKYPTVTKSELLEISLVTVPGQKNAVRLVKPDGTDYKLNLLTKMQIMSNEKNNEQLQQELDQALSRNAENLIKLHKLRGVLQDQEEPILLSLAIKDYESVAKLLETRQASKPDSSGLLAKQLVALHTQRLGLTPAEVTVYEKAATVDYEATRLALESRRGKETIEAFLGDVKNQKSQKVDRSAWTYLDWYKYDLAGLQLMAKNEPERFKQLEADFLNESTEQGITLSE